MQDTNLGEEEDSLVAQLQLERNLFQLPAEEVRQILSRCRVPILERGDFLTLEDLNWSPEYTLTKQGYSNSEPWFGNGESYQPNMYYYVGGSSKLYASTVFRFREKDFEVRTHADGQPQNGQKNTRTSSYLLKLLMLWRIRPTWLIKLSIPDLFDQPRQCWPRPANLGIYGSELHP